MKTMRTGLVLVGIAALGCALATAQKPTVKKGPAPMTSPTSGKEMYMAYCASCHGTDGKGDGPAAPAMKTPPPDLTKLAQKNGGQFSAAKVAQVIRGDVDAPAHGSKDMPVWGPVLSSVSGHSESELTLRVHNLTSYIESLQTK